MDIEQMRRINMLSKELQKHRFATSSQDGYRLAGAALGQQMQAATLELQETQTQQQMSPSFQLQQQPELQQQSQPQSPFDLRQAQSTEDSDQYLLNKKIEILVKKNCTQLETQIEGMREMITALTDELDHVKKALAKREEPRVIMATEAPREAPHIAVPEQPKKEAAPYHPKQGNVNAADVAIEKMFYFGNKR